jgi:uncharacterized protein (TIGR00369 family)
MDLKQVAQLMLHLSPAKKAEMITQFIFGLDKTLGVIFTSIDDDKAEGFCDIDDHHLQPYGLVHGGVYCTLGETFCSTGAALSELKNGKNAVGISNQTNFLKAARKGDRLTVVATPLESQGSRHTWRAEIRDGDNNLCATSIVNLAILDSERKIGGEELEMKALED